MSLELFDLTGKVALVTGGTHGLGMAIAKGLGNAGAKIVVNDIFQEKLDEAKAEYAKDGHDVATYNFNVTDEEAVVKGIAKIEKEVGPIDILVNNAGGLFARKTLPEFDESFYDLVMNVNFKSFNIQFRVASYSN